MAKTSVNNVVLATAIAAITTTGLAQAHEKGDLILRAGPILVEPQEESESIDIQSPDLGLVAGAKVGVNNDVQLGLTATYMLTDKIGVEVLQRHFHTRFMLRAQLQALASWATQTTCHPRFPYNTTCLSRKRISNLMWVRA